MGDSSKGPVAGTEGASVFAPALSSPITCVARSYAVAWAFPTYAHARGGHHAHTSFRIFFVAWRGTKVLSIMRHPTGSRHADEGKASLVSGFTSSRRLPTTGARSARLGSHP